MVEGTPFELCSDHKALETKVAKSRHDPPLNDRQARWVEALMKFPCTFRWIKGETNAVADALSRYPPVCQTVMVVQAATVGLWKRIQYLANCDPSYERLRKAAADPHSDLSESHGVVIDSSGRIHVPSDEELRTFLISENHDVPLGGHFGAERTLDLVQRHWTWTGIARDIREYVRSCHECQRQKHLNTTPAGLLHPIVAKRPWQLITLDLVGGLPPSGSARHTQVLVMVDKFSKYVCLEPCATEIDARQTAEIFQKRVIAEHGVPQVVISDRGPQFASQVWKHVLTAMGSKVALAATHHPQSDGQSERSIQTLTRLIRTYAHKDPENWSSHLPFHPVCYE